MQENWSRRHKFVALEDDTIASLLQPVFPNKHINTIELLTAGNCNTNYKICLDGLDDAFVLRIYVRDPTACQKERDIFQLVHQHVPVPELLYTHISKTPAEPTYMVMKWVDGVLLSDILKNGDTTAIIACAYDSGRILAHIGRYTFPRAGFFTPGLTIAEPPDEGEVSMLSYIEQFLFKGRAGQLLGTELTQRLWNFVTQHAEYFTLLADTASLVHSDFKGFNILLQPASGKWHVSAVLDWEFAFAGSPLFDIANMLRYEHIHPPQFATQFIRGYQEHGGQLPANWKKASKLVDLLSLCDFLNIPDPNAAMIEEVTALIVNTLVCWGTF